MTDPTLENYIREMDDAMRTLPRSQRKLELEEMRAHIEALYKEARESGIDDDAAILKVRAQFGEPGDVGRDVAASWNTRPHLVIRFLVIYALSAMVIFGFLSTTMDQPDDLWNTPTSRVATALLLPLIVFILRSAHLYRMRHKLKDKLGS